jgi:hypothetical protein
MTRLGGRQGSAIGPCNKIILPNGWEKSVKPFVDFTERGIIATAVSRC